MLPSDICFSQATINNYFDSKGKHANVKIGETLDELCEGNITIQDIPKIRVVLKDGKYYTEDNRRLWVFKQLQKLGRCGEIRVRASNSIETMFRREEKFTTTNGGAAVTIRGPPGGSWYKKARRVSDVSKVGYTRRVSDVSNVGYTGSTSYGGSVPSTAPAPSYQHRPSSNTGHASFRSKHQETNVSQFKFTETNSCNSSSSRAPPWSYAHQQNSNTAYQNVNSPRPVPPNTGPHRDERVHRPPRNDDGFGLTGVLVTVGVAAVWLLGKAIFGR